MGTRAIIDDGPANLTIPVVRGDDVSRLWELFSSYAGFDGATTTVELDITGRTYTSTIAASKGGTSVATPTCTVTNAALGQLTWALTDTQTDALTAARYVFDIVENAGTTTERTIVLGTIVVTGRATL
jgi:hypothetical protein